jgi:hypothetical protein
MGAGVHENVPPLSVRRRRAVHLGVCRRLVRTDRHILHDSYDFQPGSRLFARLGRGLAHELPDGALPTQHKADESLIDNGDIPALVDLDRGEKASRKHWLLKGFEVVQAGGCGLHLERIAAFSACRRDLEPDFTPLILAR